MNQNKNIKYLILAFLTVCTLLNRPENAIGQNPAHGIAYDLEYSVICLVDSIATDTINQFWRFTHANSPGTFTRDVNFDFSAPYTVAGTVLSCKEYYAVEDVGPHPFLTEADSLNAWGNGVDTDLNGLNNSIVGFEAAENIDNSSFNLSVFGTQALQSATSSFNMNITGAFAAQNAVNPNQAVVNGAFAAQNATGLGGVVGGYLAARNGIIANGVYLGNQAATGGNLRDAVILGILSGNNNLDKNDGIFIGRSVIQNSSASGHTGDILIGARAGSESNATTLLGTGRETLRFLGGNQITSTGHYSGWQGYIENSSFFGEKVGNRIWGKNITALGNFNLWSDVGDNTTSLGSLNGINKSKGYNAILIGKEVFNEPVLDSTAVDFITPSNVTAGDYPSGTITTLDTIISQLGANIGDTIFIYGNKLQYSNTGDAGAPYPVQSIQPGVVLNDSTVATLYEQVSTVTQSGFVYGAPDLNNYTLIGNYIEPDKSNQIKIGSPGQTEFKLNEDVSVIDFAGIQIHTGSGSPEGIVTAPPGSLYSNTAGGAGTTLYVKESGTSNTGWVAK